MLYQIIQQRQRTIDSLQNNFIKIEKDKEKYYLHLKKLQTQIENLSEITRASLNSYDNSNKSKIEAINDFMDKHELTVFSNSSGGCPFGNINIYQHEIIRIKKWNGRIKSLINQYCNVKHVGQQELQNKQKLYKQQIQKTRKQLVSENQNANQNQQNKTSKATIKITTCQENEYTEILNENKNVAMW